MYHDLMTASHVAAAIVNSNRTKASDKFFVWKDLHPMHIAQPKPKATGKQVLAQMAAMGKGEWEFLPGYDLEGIAS